MNPTWLTFVNYRLVPASVSMALGSVLVFSNVKTDLVLFEGKLATGTTLLYCAIMAALAFLPNSRPDIIVRLHIAAGMLAVLVVSARVASFAKLAAADRPDLWSAVFVRAELLVLLFSWHLTSLDRIGRRWSQP